MNKDELIEKLEEAKERLDHYQTEGNTEYIDLCREEICEIEEEIAELEMNKEEKTIEQLTSEYLENEQNKKECYETYATDNVILKKCNKYFEEVSNE